ncbi:hypothetical protein ACH47Z_08250 [Streptomyces sp. NPDC020192]|uniref:hypothetical protein n=1 Tax=Streptomyces sp. NPDC020192 TaxID=3365066 RepID=UPI0037B9FD7E
MQHSRKPDTPPDETSPLPDGSSGPEAWLMGAVREAVGEVPPRLLTEVASWPAPAPKT